MINKLLCKLLIMCALLPFQATAAPYSASVINAKTGEVLHADNSEMRVHPAGLTKLMTLFTAFHAIETGIIKLDDEVQVSRNASSEPEVKLGLVTGSSLKVSHLIRAVGVKGANDASTALAEAIDGSETAFARRMTMISQELGLKKSSWKNAHGLTQSGHLSTAYDISILLMRLRTKFPDYFNLLNRRETDAGVRRVVNSGNRMLSKIKGARAAKYGYTRAAGFCGAVYVERKGRSVIAVVMGGRSYSSTVNQLEKLIDESFNQIN